MDNSELKRLNSYPDLSLDDFLKKEKKIKSLWIEIIKERKFPESEIYAIHDCIVDYQELVQSGEILDTIVDVLEINLM